MSVPTLPDQVRVRPATPDDVPHILGFIRELAEFEKLAHEVVATEPLLHAALFAARPVAESLLAEWDGKPAGFALFFHNFSTFLARPGIHLEDLYVRRELRGRGIGTALLLRLMRLAGERGCGRVEWSVLDWNQPAIDFYRSLGAEPMNDWTVFRVCGATLARLAAPR
jgi:GNAT superfamily N-acetyltransferase